MKTFFLFSIVALLPFYSAFSQLQSITIHGRVKYENGIRAANQTVSIYLGETKLTETTTDSLGDYVVLYQSYGKMDKVDLHIAGEMKDKFVPQDEPIEYNSIINLWRARPCRYGRNNYSYDSQIWNTGNSTFYRSFSYGADLQRPQDRMFRSPYGTFAYYKPDHTEYSYFLHSISYKFAIKDEKNKPIKNAEIRMKVGKNESYWGKTDGNGNVTMNITSKEGIIRTVISINAQGVKSRNLYQKLSSENSYDIRLKNNKQN